MKSAFAWVMAAASAALIILVTVVGVAHQNASPDPAPRAYSVKRDCWRGPALQCDLYYATPEGWLRSFRDV